MRFNWKAFVEEAIKRHRLYHTALTISDMRVCQVKTCQMATMWRATYRDRREDAHYDWYD